jgi:HlyD family secretion protein
VAPFVSEARDQDRTVEIEVEFDVEVPVAGLKAGMSADVDLILERTDPSARRLSTLAILEGFRVLVVREGRAVEIEIETGLSNWEFTEITAGLEEGTEVIVSLDREDVRHGALVVVQDEPER